MQTSNTLGQCAVIICEKVIVHDVVLVGELSKLLIYGFSEDKQSVIHRESLSSGILIKEKHTAHHAACCSSN